MRDRWRGNNIDLGRLTQGTKQFFIDHGFQNKMEQTPNGYRIEANTEKILHTQLKITVEILGQPDDFTIEFIVGKQRKGSFSPSMVIGYVTSAFGGGNLFRSDLRLKESLDRLEKMFWEHVDHQIAELTQTALTK